MSVFVERVVNESPDALQLLIASHPSFPLLASASFSESNGGQVVIVDEEGDRRGSLKDHPTSQVTLLSWHCSKKILTVGYESGEVDEWKEEDVDMENERDDLTTRMSTVHQSSVHLGCWNASGTHLITADVEGCVVGWRRGERMESRLQMVFHHDLKDKINDLVFVAATSDIDLDVSVRGVKGAAAWSSTLSLAGSSSGSVYALSIEGTCSEVLQTEGQSGVRTMIMTAPHTVAIVTESMVIGHFRLEMEKSESLRLKELQRVKLSLRSKESSVVTTWMLNGYLAVGSEGYVRIYNLKTDLNIVLMANSMAGNESISCLDFTQSMLVAGTNSGRVFVWTNVDDTLDDENAWSPVDEISDLDPEPIRGLVFLKGCRSTTLGKLSSRRVCLVHEQLRAVASHNDVAVIQSGPSDFNIVFYDKIEKQSYVDNISTDVVIMKLVVSAQHVVVLSNVVNELNEILVYEVKAELRHALKADNFDADAVDVALFESNVYTLDNSRRVISVRNLGGVVKQTLKLGDTDGFGLEINVHGHFLNTITSATIVKVWDLSRREARLHAHPINLRDKMNDDDNNDDDNTIMARVNVDASSLAFSNSNTSLLHVLDLESSLVVTIDLNRNNEDEKTKKLVIADFKWDERHSTLLVVQMNRENLISLFVHEEKGVVVHDTITVIDNSLKLVGVNCPRVVFVGNTGSDTNKTKKMEKATVVFRGLRDLESEVGEAVSTSSLLGFALELCVGNASGALRHIETAAAGQPVWRNLARMCVNSRRLDVARVCLGKMEDAVAARAVRAAIEEKREESVVMAILAIHLDMIEEAKHILKEAGHFQMLNTLFQDLNEWEEALETASSDDRLHLRHTHYRYGQRLESMMDTESAIAHFEQSGMGGLLRIPRMLFVDINALQSYVESGKAHCETKRWLAQYLESSSSVNNNEEMEAALHYYEQAEDYLSVVRVLCYCDQMDKAIEVAERTSNRAACYHLARQLENAGHTDRAINFFSRAKAYANAIRLCREQGDRDDQVWNLALMSTSATDKLEAARHFERSSSKPRFDRAVVLYREAGFLGKALDLAISSNQHNALQDVVRRLDEKKVMLQPHLLNRAADFFLDNNQFDKAVDLYVAGHQHAQALELCLKHNVSVSEQLADKLANDDVHMMRSVAEVAYRQGSYHVAAQKWTQSGDRLQAMKALLKSGDTQRVIFFANVSRDSQIYILAANYLQTLDWRANADVMRTIVTFYTRAKAHMLLGLFYEACAEVEVDEYHNYEKAHAALKEADKALGKVGEESGERRRVQTRMRMVEMFVQAQNLMDDDTSADDFVRVCEQLLRSEHLEDHVRKGDVLALMVEHHVRRRNFKKALDIVNHMQKEHIDVHYYVDNNLLKAIADVMGTQFAEAHSQLASNEQEDDQPQR